MRKRNRGQAIDINAGDWNRLCDLAAQRVGQTAGSGASIPAGCIWVKNTLGRDLDRYAAVCIGSPVLAEPMTGKNDPIFSLTNGSLQAQGQNDPVIGILQEPIADTRFGQARISGVTPASFIFSESNSGGLNTVPGEFATISDDKDMLTLSTFGAIRVLQRNLSNNSAQTGAGKYWMVDLGHPDSIGSAEIAYTTAWTSTPDEDRTWTNPAYGDFMRLGVHGDGENGSLIPTGKLYISRPGRYEVTVDWFFQPVSSPSWSTGDRCEWRVVWTSGGSQFDGFAVDQWGRPGIAIGGQRSFYFTLIGGGPQLIPTPGIQCYRVPTSGSATAISITGSGRVSIVRFGPSGQTSGGGARTAWWTKAKRDASWARGASDGPI